MTVEIRSQIAGRWINGDGATSLSINPARPNETVGTVRPLSEPAVVDAIEAASEALTRWRFVPIHERARILARTGALLEQRRDDFAVELTREQGKTLNDARGEIQRAADVFRYNASLANLQTGTTYASPRQTEHIWTQRVPLGVVSLITPWNIPLAIPSWKLAPALLCGNTVVWKPASLVPLIAQRLMEILLEAGLPRGVCNLTLADNRAAGALLSHPKIRACSFTGSTAVGKKLIAQGAAHGIKVQAEMGGKNSAIVMADADVEWAVDQIISAAMLQSGQRCTATSRALINRGIFDEVVTNLVQRSDRLVIGDGLDPASDLGPVASEDRQKEILDYVETARSGGASLLTSEASGTDNEGFFVRPTVISEVGTDDPIFCEEVFGPVLAVVPFDDPEEGLALANHGNYGLAGAIFTNSFDEIAAAIDQFDVGVLHINSESCGADPHVPFGGVKDSGTSQREMGTTALEFFSETKTIYLRPAPRR